VSEKASEFAGARVSVEPIGGGHRDIDARCASGWREQIRSSPSASSGSDVSAVTRTLCGVVPTWWSVTYGWWARTVRTTMGGCGGRRSGSFRRSALDSGLRVATVAPWQLRGHGVVEAVADPAAERLYATLLDDVRTPLARPAPASGTFTVDGHPVEVVDAASPAPACPILWAPDNPVGVPTAGGPAVAAGMWVLQPLSPGTHTVTISGPAGTFSGAVPYELHVLAR
jgi:hypothetical protein